MENYNRLKKEFGSISHLHYLCRILAWEEAVSMPSGADQTRAEAVATLKKLIHKMTVSKKMGTLISKAKNEKLPSMLDSANLNLTEKHYNHLSCISSKLLDKSTKATLTALQAWRKYKAENNWKDFHPILEKSFSLQKTIAEIKSQKFGLSPYNVLIDSFAPGLTRENIDKVFSPLVSELVPLRAKILERQQKQQVSIQKFPLSREKQQQLFKDLMEKLYFNFDNGRFDECLYAYCDGIATDMRITMNYDNNDFLEGLFAVLHETGHAVYEQSMPKERCFQLVGKPQCYLTHESMAFIYEREIGRSKPFFKGLHALLNKLNNAPLSYTESELEIAANQIEQHSLIRVKTDEVNYPFHIILRYELEKALFDGDIKIADLPTLWNEKMMEYFDISTESNYKEGVMQDVHWPFGYFGYFPVYLCAQLMAPQLLTNFTQSAGNFMKDIEALEFKSINQWLNKNIYQYAGSKNYREILLLNGHNELNHAHFIQNLNSRYLS